MVSPSHRNWKYLDTFDCIYSHFDLSCLLYEFNNRGWYWIWNVFHTFLLCRCYKLLALFRNGVATQQRHLVVILKWPQKVCFHTFRCHSPRVLRRSECLDYFGILVFSVSAFLPVIYFLFRCDTSWRYIYLSALLILSIGILFLISWEPFSRDEYRIYKVIAFSSQGSTNHFRPNYGLGKPRNMLIPISV